MGNSIPKIGVELFENESLEVGLAERILQLSGMSVEVLAFVMNSDHLRLLKESTIMVLLRS